MDFSFLSVSKGQISGTFHGVKFTYRVPTNSEDDEFTSIQFRQLTEGKSLTESLAPNKKVARSKGEDDKVIPFSKLGLKRFKALCINWEPSFSVGGKELKYSKENVELVCEDLPKLAQQVDSVLWSKYTETIEEEQGN
jgi:hypothetical protein